MIFVKYSILDSTYFTFRKWYKSLKKLVKHLVSITEVVKSYQDRKDLISVRSFFVWITQNIKYIIHIFYRDL